MSQVDDVRWVTLPSHADDRGVLTAIEGNKDIPFEIKRVFYMHHITEDRAGHAHRDTDQLIIPITGSFSIKVSDGVNEREFDMRDTEKGVYVPRMLFTCLRQFSDGAVCLVLANTSYDMSRSIRTWEAFVNERGDQSA